MSIICAKLLHFLDICKFFYTFAHFLHKKRSFFAFFYSANVKYMLYDLI